MIQNISTLVADLSETSPNLGMLNKEYVSLIERGRSEMVMGLALIHHLCIGKNLSISHVAELFAQLATRYLIVEFIPKDDSKVKFMLESREDIFTDYHINHFKNCFSLFFDLVEEKNIEGSKRTIFLWARTQK